MRIEVAGTVQRPETADRAADRPISYLVKEKTERAVAGLVGLSCCSSQDCLKKIPDNGAVAKRMFAVIPAPVFMHGDHV